MTQATQLDAETKKQIIALVSDPQKLKQILSSEGGKEELFKYAEADPEIAAALEKGLAKLSNEGTSQQKQEDKPKENRQNQQQQQRKPEQRNERQQSRQEQRKPEREQSNGSNERVSKGGKVKKLMKFLWILLLAIAAVVILNVVSKFVLGWLPEDIRKLVLTGLFIAAIAGFILSGVFEYLTEPPGSAIALGFIAGYCFLINIEGYYQVMPGVDIALLPKPFIDDGANPLLFFSNRLYADSKFWIAFFIAVSIQLLQAYVWRLVDKIRKSGRGKNWKFKDLAFKWGLIVIFSYLCDFFQAVSSYPILGQAPFVILKNICYIIISMFFAEFFYNLAVSSQHEEELEQRGQYRGALN